MNQILYTPKEKNYRKMLVLLQLDIYIVLLFSLVLFICFEKVARKNQNEISRLTIKTNQLNSLYKSINPPLALNGNTVAILGTINIPKINLSYPILDTCSEALLKISVCKFYGPSTNVPGNLCIVGHNYNNNNFFSDLFLLEIEDKISVDFSKSSSNIYSVYKIYETSADDTSCLSQETNRQI